MPITIFFCYAHEDEVHLKALQAHLKPLQRQGIIDTWHDRNISAGREWEREIDTHLNTAQMILLLVSADFMASDYCYGIEMQRAMERHQRRETYVIPVILRPVYWRESPFGTLQSLPTDGQPIVSANWHSIDEALFNVTEGIRAAIEKFTMPSTAIFIHHIENTQQRKTLQPEAAENPTKRARFTLIRTLEGHERSIHSVALSNDGRILASGSADKTIKVWNTADGRILHTLTGHTDEVLSVALSDDAHILVSGSADKTVKLWDVTTGALLHTFEDHTGVVYGVALTANGHILISGGSDMAIKVWDVPARTLLYTFTESSLYPHYWVLSVAVSADGQTIAASRILSVQVWDVLTRTIQHTFREHSQAIWSVAISADGQTVVSGSDDRTIKVWDVASGRVRHTFKRHLNVVNAVAMSDDGQIIASGGRDGLVKVWNIANRTAQQTLKGHTGIVFSIALSGDGRTLVSGSDDQTIKIWKKQ